MAVRKKLSTSAENTAPKSSKGSTAGPKPKRAPTSSGEASSPPLSETERHILEHIGRYRISVRHVIAKLFFEGYKTRATEALAKLEEQGRIAIVKRALPQGYSYYQLTQKGCAGIGVTEERARALSGLGLARSLAVLWFATMNGARRARFRDDQLPPGIPPVPGRPAHVGEFISENSARIYRVHVVAEDRDHSYPLKEIRQAIDEISSTREGEALIASGAYGFAILVHEDEKKARFMEALALQREKLPEGALVIVETVPSPGNFPLFVKK